jgi:hypothetical protein
MADLDVQRKATAVPEDDYTTGELIFWIVGILAIPLVPILMVMFLTPYSGF